MKPVKTKRELKEESLLDLRKAKVYLQTQSAAAANYKARELLEDAIQDVIFVIVRISRELLNQNLV